VSDQSVSFSSMILSEIFSEECLIDFRELRGEHSGENMANAVWETLENYGIEGRVSSISGIFAPS
jgi:hypothetical protein